MDYTKGEWKFRHPVNNDYTIYVGEYGKGITQVALIWESLPNAEANAHLISASPELYEACKEMLAELQQTKGISLKWLKKWQEAIAKADEKET